MSNIKISNLPPETNLSSINGLAGYNNSGTVKISGADLIGALTLNTVLTTSNQASTEIQTISDITRFTSSSFSGENIKLTSNGLTRSAGTLYVETADTGIQFKVDSSLTTDTVEFNLGGISRFNINYRGALGVGTNAADYGSAGQVLTSNGSSTAASWGSAPSLNLQTVVNTGNIINNQNSVGTIIINDGNVTRSMRLGEFDNSSSKWGIEFKEGVNSTEFSIGVPLDKILNIGYSTTSTYGVEYSTDSATSTSKLSLGSAMTLELNSGTILELADTSLFKTKQTTGIGEGDAGQVLTSRGSNLSPEWKDPLPSPLFNVIGGASPGSGIQTWDLDDGYNASFACNPIGNTLALSNWSEGDTGVLVLTSKSSAFNFPANSIFAGGAPTLVDDQIHVFSLLYKSATELIWSYGLDFKA